MKAAVSTMATLAMTTLAMTPLLLSGCDGKPAETAPAPGTAAATAAREESVAAVLVSGAAPAQVRFRIDKRPVQGTPFVLRLEFAGLPVEPALLLAVGPADEFAADPALVTLPAAPGGRASQEITVVPRKTGLVELPVHLRSGREGAEAVYSVPVLVGAAAP